MYTPQEKEEIERVGEVFASYIRDARNLDGQPRCQLVWLESMQTYVLIKNYSETDKILERDLTVKPIDNGAHLLQELACDMVNAIYLKTIVDGPEPHTKTLAEAEAMVYSAGQIAAERMAPYGVDLPEYRDAIAIILDGFHKGYLRDVREEAAQMERAITL